MPQASSDATSLNSVQARIDTHRVEASNRLLGLLDKVPVPGLAESLRELPQPRLWGLSSHAFRTALAAARGQGTDLHGWVVAGTAALEVHSLGNQLVVPAEHCVSVRAGSEMPISVVDPALLGVTAPEEERHRVAAEALSVLAEIGYGRFVDANLAVIVMLRPRDVTEKSDSWTTTALRSTIYSDFSHSGELFTKEILHEATHNWLNDALSAYDLDLDGPEIYYSPWKKKNRSAYGMLHSVMAFSRVCNLLTHIHAVSADPKVRAYANLVSATERERLTSVQPQFDVLLDSLAGHPIATLVDQEYRRAVKE